MCVSSFPSYVRDCRLSEQISRRLMSTDLRVSLSFCFRVRKTNLMHNLSSDYFVNQPLHVSGIFVAHHQEVYCIYTAFVRVAAFI